MQAQIVDGKAIAASWHEAVKKECARLFSRYGARPGLAVILVGENPASVSYVKAKEKACLEDGILSKPFHLPLSATEEEVLGLIASLNRDDSVHGILVQLPLPAHISEEKVIDAISPEKDVDGFTPVNCGRLLLGRDTLLPCTPNGIVEMLLSLGVETSGARTVVVGRSNIVGKPLANLLLRRAKGGNATVTVCHTGTKDLASHTMEADILIVASGSPKTVTGDMIKPGAAVIDVGVNRVPDPSAKRGYRLVGDVDFDSAKEVAGLLTPVPGGVGPLTIAMLMRNTLAAAVKTLEK